MPEAKALAQIKAKGYSEKYQTKGKKIVLIGIGFSSEKRNITDFFWEEETLKITTAPLPSQKTAQIILP